MNEALRQPLPLNERLQVFVRDWLMPSLSPKLKFAIKASLAVTIAYLIPISQGWQSGYTAAITVMLIASIGSVGESVTKGMFRVIGTVIGAALGMALIALFPQERLTYLVLLSVTVTLILYLGRAYKGDTTIFLLTAMTAMFMFKEGKVDDVFMYGIDKTLMTVLGIVVYTLVGILLWPVRLQDERARTATELSQRSLELLEATGKAERKALVEKIIPLEQKLRASTQGRGDTSAQMGLSPAQWRSIVEDHVRANAQLYLLAEQLDDIPRLDEAVPGFATVREAIASLYRAFPTVWEKGEQIPVPPAWTPDYDRETLTAMSHLERAAVVQAARTARRLLERLRTLAEKLNAMASPQPTRFKTEDPIRSRHFSWFDVEDLKGAVITFAVFWTAIAAWILFNTPEGFSVAAVATALTLLTTYSAAKPSLLIVLFTFSFAFAGAMYIFVLPYLHNGWQLGAFLFLYAFIGFYFLPSQISVFFLLGIATLYITPDMIFNFNLFLMILLVFYIFLFILLFFDYIPFTMKPERLFTELRRRFFRLAAALVEGTAAVVGGKHAPWKRIAGNYAAAHLVPTVAKLRFWAQRIDTGYFDSVDPKALARFVEACEALGYHLRIYRQEALRLRGNPLLERAVNARFTGTTFTEALRHSENGTVADPYPVVAERMEGYLGSLLDESDYDRYDEETIAGFYELVSLNKNAWEKLERVRRTMEAIDFDALKENRF